MSKSFSILQLLALLLFSYTSVARAQCRPIQSTNTDASVYFAEALEDPTLSGEDLKSILNRIVANGHKCRSYTPCVWDALEQLDESPNDPTKVIGFYSRAEIPKGNKVSGPKVGQDFWNREHLYPAGRFNKKGCPYRDLHHLVAADSSVNNDRGNSDFDEGGVPVTDKGGTVTCEDCKEVEDVLWEPASGKQKGQIARMLFYINVRYRGSPNNLSLVEGRSDNKKKGAQAELGNLSTLLKWHCENKVSDYEKERNDGVERWQGNRNPFVDFPELAERIYGECTTMQRLVATLREMLDKMDVPESVVGSILASPLLFSLFLFYLENRN